MAIAADAASNSGNQGATASYSWSHTCSGSNRLLVVSVGQRTTAGNTVSGVTYNGVALTQVQAINNGSRRADLWYLVGPASGANTVQVTLSATPTSSAGMAFSLTGVDQTTPLDAGNATTGSTLTPSISITTVANSAWVVDCFMGGAGTITDYVTNQAQQAKLQPSSGFFAGQSSFGPVGPPAATTLSGTLSGSAPLWSYVAESFTPAPAPSSVFPRRPHGLIIR